MTPTDATREHSPTTAIRIRATLAGLGFGLLLGGTALGLYGVFWATTVATRLPDNIPQDAPKTFAIAAALTGALLLVLTSAAFRRGRESQGSENFAGRFELWAIITAGFILVVLAVMAYANDLPRVYADIRTGYPYFSRLPAAVAATVLVATGGLFVLGLLRRVTTAWRIGTRAVVVPIVMGLAVSAALGVAAVRAGDDSVNIDHTTTAATAIPDSPRRLGRERYRIQLPPQDKDHSFVDGFADIVAAGTGFVTPTPTGITAYDGATGEERWHYRRIPQNGEHEMGYEPNSLFAADDGTVVLAAWRKLPYQAFDAVTGELLWTDSDFLRHARDGWSQVGRNNDSALPQLLMLATATQTARYDARTGNRLWLTEVDSSRCPGPDRDSGRYYGTHTSTDKTVYRILKCQGDGQSWYQIHAFDAETGRQVATRDFAHRPTIDGVADLQVQRMGNTLAVGWGDPEHRGDYYLLIDTPSRLATTPVHRDQFTPAGADPTGPQVAKTSTAGMEVGDIENDDPAYTVTNMRIQWTTFQPPITFLEDEIIAPVRDKSIDSNRLHMHSWNRANGAPASYQPVEQGNEYCEYITTAAVASALLVVCTPQAYHQEPVTVVGYVPEPD